MIFLHFEDNPNINLADPDWDKLYTRGEVVNMIKEMFFHQENMSALMTALFSLWETKLQTVHKI